MKALLCLFILAFAALALGDPAGLGGRMLDFLVALFFMECAVVLLEGLAYAPLLKIGWFWALLISLVANVSSFLIGVTVIGSIGSRFPLTAFGIAVVAVLVALAVEVPIVMLGVNEIRRWNLKTGRGKPPASPKEVLRTALIINLVTCAVLNLVINQVAS